MSREELDALRRKADELAKSQNPDAGAVLDLVGKFEKRSEFTPARRLLEQVRPRLAGDPDHEKLAQKHALHTYKDPNLPADRRYREALAILEEIGLRSGSCANGETLGQGGAIHKRLWEAGGQTEHLHTALAFYRAAWARDPQRDLGWGGVNAAYLLDLLASREQAAAALTGSEPSQAAGWREQARDLRHELLDRLPQLLEAQGQADAYWALATLAEIHFGLEDYAAAGEWLERAGAAEPGIWERQTTARQLVGIARLHGVPLPEEGRKPAAWHPAWQALARLLGAETAPALLSWRGKVGLALSGGGFRAALFHLGVLARLAECDVLRSVETLSTVSGGSIVGAHYYLRLRRLLQTHPDADIGRRDYVDLVRRLIGDSLAGVERNLRVRALGNLWANVKMIFSSRYSRSMRIGELYEAHLFSRVPDNRNEPRPLQLHRLRVHPAAGVSPAAAGPDFKPRTGNWLRQAKVPNLMLNTTSLNSGHNWHFTASWMGEPPGLLGDEIDMNERYRRLYYEQAPHEALRTYRLAYAVAASSCVPAMFEPLPLKDLYPGRTVRLVDGGVHDNQGMGALLDDDCNLILCSDASGQMESQPDPANGMLGAFWRSDGILQDRVREAQYRDLRVRAEGGALQGLFFVHLKQELEPAPIDWIDCQDPQSGPCGPSCTSYGVDREIQRLLSEIRTDLDSFTEVEAYALMASGYLLTAHELRELDRNHRAAGLPGTWGGFDVDAPAWTREDGGDYWPFAPLIPIMALPRGSADLRRRDLARQLAAGSIMFFRVWHLVPWLRRGAYALGIAGALAAAIWTWLHWEQTYSWQISFGVSSAVVALVLAVLAVANPLFKYLNPRKASQNALAGAAAALFGFAGSWIHLLLFEPLLNRRGRLARLLRLPAGD